MADHGVSLVDAAMPGMLPVINEECVRQAVRTGLGLKAQINKRSVNTAVLVEDGQTVVIGGVYEFRDRSDVSKVPFLGDVPFLGNLFKNAVDAMEQMTGTVAVEARHTVSSCAMIWPWNGRRIRYVRH